jgi:thioester reductase-like protein
MATALLTGFPGFIGKRLVAKLLADDPKLGVVALVEERMLDAARDAAAEIDAKRIEVVAGDIGERGLGLSDPDREALEKNVTLVFHLAAIYDLAVPLEIAQRVNVDGTGNVLDFCLAAKKLERLAYVSTAYVSGLRTGRVYEHELVMGQQFKNHYESTKFQAEVWVRQLMDRVPTTILRPAIVVGDSQTGETQKFDGPYFMLRAIAEAESRGQALMNFGRAGAPFNVVPVDFVVEAIAAAASDPATAGETLHLVDPEPLSASQLADTLSREYAGRPPRGRIPAASVETALRFSAIRKRFGGTPRESIVYLNHPVSYDTRRAVELLAPHGLRPPPFSTYAPAMVAFFKAHEEDPAFARV